MITEIDILNLSPVEVAELKELTHKDDGYMSFMLDCIRIGLKQGKTDFYGKAYGFYENDTIVGWILLQNLTYRYQDYIDLMIYVNSDCRGRSIGTQLLDFVKSNFDLKIALYSKKGDPREKLFKKFTEHPFYVFDMDHYNKTLEYRLL